MSLFSYRTPKARLGELTETLMESPRGEGSLARAGPLPRASASCRLGHPGRGASCPSTVDITVPQPLPPLSPGVSALHQLCAPSAATTPTCSQTHQAPGLHLLPGTWDMSSRPALSLPAREEWSGLWRGCRERAQSPSRDRQASATAIAGV